MALKKASVGIEQLIDHTSGPRITAHIVFDQVYAADQHEELHYKHPRGGQPKYLETALFEGFPTAVQKFANFMLSRRKSLPERWAEGARTISRQAARNAPVFAADLRDSASLEVREGQSVVVYDPPRQHRLTEPEIDAKDYMREALGVKD